MKQKYIEKNYGGLIKVPEEETTETQMVRGKTSAFSVVSFFKGIFFYQELKT